MLTLTTVLSIYFLKGIFPANFEKFDVAQFLKSSKTTNVSHAEQNHLNVFQL